MRKLLKRKALFSFTFFLFLNISIFFFYNLDFDNTTSENTAFYYENPRDSYFNNSLLPIYINGAASGIGAKNWDWALSKPWCTLDDGVYIIENVVINNQDQANCILIENSNVCFTIRNCSVMSSGVSNIGIKLKNTNNSLIINNNFSSKNIGIILENSHFNRILNNTAFYNNEFGILLHSYSEDNTIMGNNLRYNGNNGIRLQVGSKRNEIIGNSIKTNSFYGIFIHGDVGKLIPRDNLFYMNNISGNNGNAKDDGVDNKWDDGSIGNYWGDYTGIDIDGDCIGDTPYDIDTNIQDNFPLMANWTPPKPPETFHLTSNADNPDKDGAFNLTWTVSHGADNYSVYISDTQIVKIDENLKIIAYQNATSPCLISGMLTGGYYFIVVAYNDSGETISNNKYIVVLLSGDEPLPNDNNENNDIFILIIAIIIISGSAITYLGVISNHKIKIRNSFSTEIGRKNINTQQKSHTKLKSEIKPQRIEIIPKSIQDRPKKIKSKKIVTEFYEEFEKETGKHAIWHGKITKGYLAWKDKRESI